MCLGGGGEWGGVLIPLLLKFLSGDPPLGRLGKREGVWGRGTGR